MIWYAAGVPGGPQIEREKEMRSSMSIARLISFYHIKQGMTTLIHYKEINETDES